MDDNPKSKDPLVSVMMPTYNGAAHLREAIDSMLNQTYTHWELIIVDDGSTDETPEILQEYSRLDKRINPYRIAHGGRGKARNKCLEESSGKYIAVCDSDDISLPDRFKKHVDFLEQHPDIGVVSAQSLFFDSQNVPTSSVAYPEDPYVIKARFDKGKMGVCHGASMFRRELIDQVGPYSEECLRAQDLEFFLRVNEVSRFASLPEHLLLYRNNPSNTTYRFWVRLCKYGRYAVNCRDRFRLQLVPIRFVDWEKTFDCLWRVYLVDNLRYVKFWLKFKTRLHRR
jgi:glycosyltransferase involved in cell wall biosynthesis